MYVVEERVKFYSNFIQGVKNTMDNPTHFYCEESASLPARYLNSVCRISTSLEAPCRGTRVREVARSPDRRLLALSIVLRPNSFLLAALLYCTVFNVNS